ncbi:hypothetical protein V6Z12_A08G022600 [Gossypium hirsutum]
MYAFSTDLSLFLFWTFLITVKESPSMITPCNPKSFPKITACKHATASAANPVSIFSWFVVLVTKVFPVQFLTMSPEHDFCILRSTAASKLILQIPWSGGLHSAVIGLKASLPHLTLLRSYSPDGTQKRTTDIHTAI